MRRLFATLALLTALAPALVSAQAPPAVPALPDTERRTSFVLSASKCACSVGWAIYGDSTDVDEWIEVWLDGVKYLSTDVSKGWALTSVTGSLATIPRPITNAVLTFTAVQTGTVQIVSAQRPRRLSQFAENRGVAARDLNQVITSLTAELRDAWDARSRSLLGLPGETFGPMPGAAACKSGFLGFDSTGLVPRCSAGGAGSGTVVGPATSVVGNFVLWNSTDGTLVKDAGFSTISLANGGTSAALTASNGGLVYSTGSALAILSGTATAGQIPRSGSSAAPSWSTATYPATTAAGTVLASATANTIAGTAAPTLGIAGTTIGTIALAGNTSGTATITPQAAAGTPTLTLPNASGTFAISATSPLALSATTGALTCTTCVTGTAAALTKTDDTNVTLTLGGTPTTALLQATSLTLGWTGQLGLTRGGTNASLTASNGGVVYSDASKLQILTATATANLPLMSAASAAPTWATVSHPTSATSGGVAYFSSTTVMASSALLATNAVVLGGGAGNPPATTANATMSTGALTLGQAGSVAGSLVLSGATGQTVTVKTAATAGNWSLTLPPDDGNSGEFLSTDGAGVATWKSAAGAGTVTSVTAANGITATTNPCTSSCTIGVLVPVFNGRLTLTTATPVMTATASAQTSVFYTPYNGNYVTLYDGTNMLATSFAELTITLGSNWTAAKLYDVYVGLDAGTLRACTGAAWTNTTTRAESLTRTNGVLLNTASMTCRYNNTTTFTCAASRCSYVGTFAVDAGAAGQVSWTYGAAASGGTAGVFNLWNMYNRLLFASVVNDSGASYTYSSATIRQARASAGNQTTIVIGLQGDSTTCIAGDQVSTAAVASSFARIGCGLDTTSAWSNVPAAGFAPTAAVTSFTAYMSGIYNVGIGQHIFSMNQQADGTNLSTFNGSGTSGGAGAWLTVQAKM